MSAAQPTQSLTDALENERRTGVAFTVNAEGQPVYNNYCGIPLDTVTAERIAAVSSKLMMHTYCLSDDLIALENTRSRVEMHIKIMKSVLQNSRIKDYAYPGLIDGLSTTVRHLESQMNGTQLD